MKTVEIPVTFDARFVENWKDDEISIEQRMRIWAAISLYLDKKISVGKAAELAGMHYGEFQDYLGKHQIPVSLLTYEEVMADLEKMN